MNYLKKVLTGILIIATFFIIYFLQANFFTWFTINGVMPNLLVIFILWIGLFIGKKTGLICGLIFGIYIDILVGKSIGISGIMLGIIGLVAEYIDKNFSKDSRLTIMLIIAASTAIYEIGIYIFQIIKFRINIEILAFLKILAIEIIFNVILSIILYPLIQKLGNLVESKFKAKTILTRYF